MDNLKNRLKLKRLRIPISVEYSLDKEVEILPVSLLSVEGMFVETTIDYPIGANVVIRFYIPEFDKVIEAVGEVIAKIEENMNRAEQWEVPGIFIKFKAMEGIDRKYLQTFLKDKSI